MIELTWFDLLDIDWEAEVILIDADWAREVTQLDADDATPQGR